MSTYRRTPAALTLWLMLVAAAAGAEPGVGSRFPPLQAQDVAGASHSTVLAEGELNLVVAITDRHGEQAMRAWFEEADGRMPPGVHRVSIVTMKLPFFVSIGAVRSRARAEVPRQYWKDTFVDKNGAMARELELADSRVPYVFAVDPDGKVLASVHAKVTSPEAEAVWRALQR